MMSGTARKMKCYTIHTVSESLTQPLRESLLSLHALTGCDTTSSFSDHGKKTCLKTFQNQPLLLKGIRRDGELAPIEQFVCKLYHSPDQAMVNQARCQLLDKVKKGLELLQPTRDALELHSMCANYQE